VSIPDIGNLTNKVLLHLLSRSAMVEVVPTVIGESRRIGYLFQHPAHPTRPQVLEIENILNRVVLFHNISKVYDLGFIDLIGNLTNKVLLHLLSRSAMVEVVPTVIGSGLGIEAISHVSTIPPSVLQSS
jgi:hypothetical protein